MTDINPDFHMFYVARWLLTHSVFHTSQLPFTGRTLGDLGKAITECHFCPPEHLSGEAVAFLKHVSITPSYPRPLRCPFCQGQMSGQKTESTSIKLREFKKKIKESFWMR